MRIKLNNYRLAGPDLVAGPGQVVDVPDQLALVLIKGGYAVQLDEPAPVETAAIQPPERALNKRGRQKR